MFNLTVVLTQNSLGKVADVTMHFTDGALAGMKLVGFKVFKDTAEAEPRVTMPCRKGTRIADSATVPVKLFRADTTPEGDINASAEEHIKQLVLDAYNTQMAAQQAALADAFDESEESDEDLDDVEDDGEL